MSRELIEQLRTAEATGEEFGIPASGSLYQMARIEIERLQTERVILNACSNTAAVLEMHSRIAALEAENAELKHDRACYDVLRDDPEFTITHRGRELSHEYLDQAVDAARATSSAAVE